MANIEIVHVTEFNESELDDRAAELSAQVSIGGVRRMLSSRRLWTVVKNLRDPAVARATLQRAKEHELEGRRGVVLAIDSQTEAAVGVGTSIPKLPLRKLALPVMPYPPVLRIPGMVQQDGGVAGPNVAAWVDNRRLLWLMETKGLYDELRTEAGDSGCWTVEPLRTVASGVHTMIDAAGFEVRGTGFYDDAGQNNHFVPMSSLFVVPPAYHG